MPEDACRRLSGMSDYEYTISENGEPFNRNCYWSSNVADFSSLSGKIFKGKLTIPSKYSIHMYICIYMHVFIHVYIYIDR